MKCPFICLLATGASFLVCKSESEAVQSCRTLCNPMDYIACHTPLSMGFSRQEYWSGLPLPSPEDLPDPGIEPGSPALWANALSSELPGKSHSFPPYIFISLLALSY